MLISETNEGSNLYRLGIYLSLGSSLVHCSLALLFIDNVLPGVYYRIAAVPVVIGITIACIALVLKYGGSKITFGLRLHKRAVLLTCVIVVIFMVVLSIWALPSFLVVMAVVLTFILNPVSMIAIIVIVVLVKTSRRSRDQRKLVPVHVGCIFSLIITTSFMFFFSLASIPVDAAAIGILGMVLYWSVANKARIQEKRAVAGSLLVIAVAMAIIPVIFDRVLLRSGESGILIERNMQGTVPAEIIPLVEGFNSSTSINWSGIHPDSDPGYYNLYFSTKDLAEYRSWVEALNPLILEPILYQPCPHRKLEYSMNGTSVSGNITVEYDNTSIILKRDDSRLLYFNVSEHLYGDEYYFTYYYFLNDSSFSKPDAYLALKSFPSGYIFTTDVVYDTYCGPVCGANVRWHQSCFLDMSMNIQVIVALSSFVLS
nr:hypothetical protein [Candidatus Sigynarchaeota archaeon]